MKHAQFVKSQELIHQHVLAQMVSSTNKVSALIALKNAKNASMVYVLNVKLEESVKSQIVLAQMDNSNKMVYANLVTINVKHAN
jgi:hypothetical protein